MEILNALGGILGIILFVIIIGLGSIFLLSLMGRASNTTFRTRGGNLIRPYRTAKELKAIDKKNSAIDDVLKKWKHQRDLETEVFDSLISSVKNISYREEDASLNIISISIDTFSSTLKINTVNSTYNASGEWLYDLEFANKLINALGIDKITYGLVDSINLINGLVTLPAKSKLEFKAIQYTINGAFKIESPKIILSAIATASLKSLFERLQKEMP